MVKLVNSKCNDWATLRALNWRPFNRDICIYVCGAKPFYCICRPYYDVMFMTFKLCTAASFCNLFSDTYDCFRKIIVGKHIVCVFNMF